MTFHRAWENAAHEHDNFAHHQFRHGTCVAVRCVKNGNTVHTRSFKINLIGANAEAANGHKPVCAIQHFLGQLRAGTDANNMHTFQRLFEGIALQRAFMTHNVFITAGFKKGDGTIVDTLQQQNADLVLGERQVRACAHVEPTK